MRPCSSGWTPCFAVSGLWRTQHQRLRPKRPLKESDGVGPIRVPSFRFRLDPNGRWPDGQPVTAEDVVATWKLYTDPGLNDLGIGTQLRNLDKPTYSTTVPEASVDSPSIPDGSPSPIFEERLNMAEV
jgi:hypothetical protein